MNKRILALLLLTGGVQVSTHATKKKPWTILVYMAADNDLAPYAQRDLQEMMAVGSNKQVTVLAYIATGHPKKIQRFIVQPHKLVEDGTTPNLDSGDEHTLIDALAWAHVNHPSKHFALVLWDHGSGPLNRNRLKPLRGICYDYTTGHYLTDRNIQHALQHTVKSFRHGKKIDIVAFDACLMSHIEIAFTLRSSADFMVASQELVPGDGMEYSRLLSAFSHTSPNPRNVAKHMVSAFHETYKKSTTWQNHTLAAIELAKLEPLVKANNELATLLKQYMEKEHLRRVMRAIMKAASKQRCTCFDEPTYIDLYDWYHNLEKCSLKMYLSTGERTHLLNVIRRGKAAISSCVIANQHGTSHPKAHGLSIYFPSRSIEQSYHHLFWSENTQWLPMLRQYIKSYWFSLAWIFKKNKTVKEEVRR